ncbi:MAG TPA: hypothetical protein VK455_03595 [Thermoplasmata archaeon]|nr:hypothetical protein [Thermoplasmata archaeon]
MMRRTVRARGHEILGLHRTRQYLFVAHLLAALTLILWVGLMIYFAIVFGPLSEGFAAEIIALLVFVFALPTFLVMLHVGAMRHSARYGDYADLVDRNSLAYAIVALFFCGLLCGIFLLLAHRRLVGYEGSPDASAEPGARF